MPLKILTQVQSSDPQKAPPCTNTSYDVEIVKIGPLVFAQLTLLPNPQNFMLYIAFQLARYHQLFHSPIIFITCSNVCYSSFALAVQPCFYVFYTLV